MDHDALGKERVGSDLVTLCERCLRRAVKLEQERGRPGTRGELQALDPNEPFNVVFAAAFAAGDGGARAQEALKIAQAHEDLMCASYNLAAIHAQAGDRNKARARLKRHFFEYAKYDAVRSKEMMEARVDAVFASIVKDPEFMSLTAGADGKLPMPRRH